MATSWRDSVTQQYRNDEISTISKVLASLEDKATPASKLMLASKFEGQIFNESSSLQDYRTKIVRRLKRFQKNYAKQAAQSSNDPNSSSSSSGKIQSDAERESRLRDVYGKSLKFVVEYGDKAVSIMAIREKDKASKLGEYVQTVKEWAVEIGLYPDDNRNQSAAGSNDSSVPFCLYRNGARIRKRVPRPPGYLDRLTDVMSLRLEQIRSHVLKISDPDRFFEECLTNLETDLLTHSTPDFPAGEIFAEGMKDIIAKNDNYGNHNKNIAAADNSLPNNDATKNVLESLEKALARVPVPRGAMGGDEHRKACLTYLQKVRASAQVLLQYPATLHKNSHPPNQHLPISDTKSQNDDALAIKGCLAKAYGAVRNSCDFLNEAFLAGSFRRHGQIKGQIQLEDAWDKLLEYDLTNPGSTSTTSTTTTPTQQDNAAIPPQPNQTTTITNDNTLITNGTTPEIVNIYDPQDEPNIDEPPHKKLKTFTPDTGTNIQSTKNICPIILSSKLLFAPGRKPPHMLLPALKRKGAILHSSSTSSSSFLSSFSSFTTWSLGMKFGNAFEMRIYFSPLIVAIRALSPHHHTARDKDRETGVNKDGKTSNEAIDGYRFKKEVIHGGLDTWISSQQNLRQFGRKFISNTTPNNNHITNFSYPTPLLRIMGLSGTHTTLGLLVAKKLEYASAVATRVLRLCFGDVAGMAYHNPNTKDFEIEMLEGTALLKFLSIARQTYDPDFVEDEV
mmetsp:Transcript_14144/g.20204  ORF Transcript_14144/g.20204 Transcript_14144/m.20204 type:complete len:732 (+) Transcript_14144:55-2250(+)